MRGNKKEQKRAAMRQVRAVQTILRRWDPIGVGPGTGDWPDNEYDGYAAHIVSLVAQGCSADELTNHLTQLRRDTIGVGGDVGSDAAIADEILAALRVEGN